VTSSIIGLKSGPSSTRRRPGPLGGDVASFRLHLAAEGKSPKTVKVYTEAVRYFAATYLLPDRGKTTCCRGCAVSEALEHPDGNCELAFPSGGMAAYFVSTSHYQRQQRPHAAPTAGEGSRVRGMISALVSAGLDGGYLANPRLAKVHWQAPPPTAGCAGAS
jgi:hypothetical protein